MAKRSLPAGMPAAWTPWMVPGRSDGALLSLLPTDVREQGLIELLEADSACSHDRSGVLEDNEAASHQRATNLIRWLDAGLPPDTQVRFYDHTGGESGWATLLGLATGLCDDALAVALLRRGADPNARYVPEADWPHGETRLHDPLPLSHLLGRRWPASHAMLHVLVRAGADLWMGGRDPRYGTRCAAIEVLLAGGIMAAETMRAARPDIDWNRRASNGECALGAVLGELWRRMLPAVYPNLSRAEATVRGDAEACGHLGDTARWLLAHGARAEGLGTEDGHPVVHVAVLLGDADLTAALVLAGADWVARNATGETVRERVERAWREQPRTGQPDAETRAAQARALQAGDAAREANFLGGELPETERRGSQRL